MRPFALAVVLALTMSAAGCGSSSSSSGSSSITAGSYSGQIRCVGADRFSNGLPVRHYLSKPAVSVTVGSGQRLQRWTYLFLGHPNTVIQTTAASPGQSFSYSAGKHIDRPGRTVVTVAETPSSHGISILNAILDWSSPSTGYIGSGTYTLALESRDKRTASYEAEKVVVKLPRYAPSKSDPVVRRTEDCRGDLSR